jgi:hypothetical protein
VIGGPSPRDTDAIPLPAIVNPATTIPVAIRGFNVAADLADILVAVNPGDRGFVNIRQQGFATNYASEIRSPNYGPPWEGPRMSLLIRNDSDGRVWLGNSTALNPSNGWPLDPGGTVLDTVSQDSWYVYTVTEPGGSVWWVEVLAWRYEG